MKKSMLIILSSLFLITMSACATKGELYVIRSLKDMVYDISMSVTEEEFCKEYSEFYGEEDGFTENGEKYIQCAGEDGHYEQLIKLNLEYDSQYDVIVQLEDKDGIFTYYIVTPYYDVLILGHTPDIKNDDRFIIMEDYEVEDAY